MTTSTKKPPALSRVQLHTLIAISRGEVSMPGPGIDVDLGTWRVGGPNGRAVTATVNSLIDKQYAQMSTVVVDDRRQAVATAAGHEEISRPSPRASQGTSWARRSRSTRCSGSARFTSAPGSAH